ncbi:MAG: HlyD family efflux transporter periplasmic adaptor subunit [Pseudomonadota bacterium]
MKIRHERPMSDLSFQVRAPLGLELSTGERLTISNWSLQGFEFPYESDVLPQEAVLSIPFQGVDIRFPIRVAQKGEGQFLSFENLTGRQRETLAVFYRSILSGKMATTEEIITSLDTPVDLVPMEETEDEKAVASAGKAPRSLRAAISILLYLCLGTLVFWTLGAGIWGKLAAVHIENARIEAVLVPHSVPDRGLVQEVLVASGDAVDQGDLLLRLTDPAGEAALAEVRSRIDLIETRLAEAAANGARLAERIASIRQELVAAHPPSMGASAAVMEAFDGRYAAEHQDLFAAHSAALQQIDSLDDELRRLRRERGRLRDAADALHVIAQSDGVVTELSALSGQLLGRGAVAVVIEAAEARQARGWLDATMAAAVYPGMAVSVEVASASGPRLLFGEVSGIEAGIDPEISPEFGMLVRVRFPGLSVEETRATLPHLAPVKLQATRAWAQSQTARWVALRARVGL